MTFDRLRVAGLAGLLLLSSTASVPLQAAVSCDGISAWSATTTYAAGTQVTYSGSLYKALVSTTNVPPNYCPACGWWQLVDACGTVASCTTVPSTPGGLSASGATTSSLNLSWSAVSTPANCSVTYSVYRGGALAASGLTGTSTTISGLSASTTYTFTVAAVDAAGTSGQSGSISATTSGVVTTCTAAPAVPTGLTASGTTASSTNLSWSAVATPANCSVTYSVFRSGSQVASGLTSTSTSITGLTASTAYSFTVAAVDAAGSSAQSGSVSVTTSGNTTNSCTGVPAYSSTAVYTNGMKVVYNNQLWNAKWWTQGEAPSTGGSGVWQYVSDCTSVACSAAPAVPTGLSSSNLTITGVTLSWGAVAAPSGCTVSYKVFQNGTQIQAPGSNSANITGLTANSTYSFTVASVDSVGASSLSAALSVTTPVTTTCAAAPAVPTGLASPSQTSSSVNLSWNAVSAPANCSVTYNVQQNGSKVLTVPTTSAVVSGLSASTSYGFTVASVDAFGASVPSATLNVATQAGGSYTAAQVLSGIQAHMTASVQVNSKPHINTMTRAQNVNVYQVTSGVYAYTSSMAIDTDGSDPDPDPDHQGQTTWQDNSGKALGAHTVPFYVLGDDCWDRTSPCPHFYYAERGITGLQFALMFYNGKCIGAVFGDTQTANNQTTSDNDSRELGEASAKAADLLGIPSSGTTGGVDDGVTVVIFSGSQWVVKGSSSSALNSNAQALVSQALNTLGSKLGL